jgi:uncharacterized membrane protein required for colicin V production
MVIGFNKGLMRSLFGIASAFLSFFLATLLYPHVARFLRVIGVYGFLKDTFASIINLQEIISEFMEDSTAQLIGALPQSSFIQNQMRANVNPVAYSVLDVSNISDYINGFFANMAINLIAIVIVYLLLRFGTSLVLNILDVLTRLPVIHSLNALGGLAFGLIEGVIVIWALMCVLTFFLLSNKDLFQQLESGSITGFFYDNNPIMGWLVTIIP